MGLVDWQDTNLLSHGTTPLLLSKELTPVALEVLYKHPHVSYPSLPKFKRCLYIPSPYHDVPKSALIRHLTIRPSPVVPSRELPSVPITHDQGSARRRPIAPYSIHESLASVLRPFPKLFSFTLKDTLVLHEADAARLFDALKLISPKKGRLEFRMWDLTESLEGSVLDGLSKPNIYAPASTFVSVPTTIATLPRNMPRNRRPGESPLTMQETWQEALLRNGEIELPAWWIEPVRSGGPPMNFTNGGSVSTWGQLMDPAPPFPEPHPPSPPPLPPTPAQMQLAQLNTMRNRVMSRLNRLYALLRPRSNIVWADFTHERAGQVIHHLQLPMLQLLEETVQSLIVAVQNRGPAPTIPAFTVANPMPNGSFTEFMQLLQRVVQEIENGPPVQDAASSSQDIQGDVGSSAIGEGQQSARQQSAGQENAGSSTRVPLEDSTTIETGASWTRSGPRSNDLDGQTALTAQPPIAYFVPSTVRSPVENPPVRTTSTHPEPARARSQLRLIELGQEGNATGSMIGSAVEAVANPSLPKVRPLAIPRTTGFRGEESTSGAGSGPREPTTTVEGGNCTRAISSNCISSRMRREPSESADTFYGHSPTITARSTTFQPPAFQAHTVQSANVQPTHVSLATASRRTRDADADLNEAQRNRTDHLYAPDDDGAYLGTAGPSNSTRNGVSADISSAGATVPAPNPSNLPQSLGDAFTDSAGRTSFSLAHYMRHLLEKLVKTHWSPRLEALYIEAMDPLASLIVRAPRLDLWTRMAVPHIRVHLPRGCNSLAVFKGAAENARDRRRRRNGEDYVVVPPGQVDENKGRVVGGDGMGGDLVHETNRLFEIEVNTIAEMQDEVWIHCGDQLPPQVCRILVGDQDWSNVVAGEWESRHAGGRRHD